MTCLKHHMDKMAREHAPMNLFRHAPTIYFQPEVTTDGLKVLKSRGTAAGGTKKPKTSR